MHTLTIVWPNRTITVAKRGYSKRQAAFWKQLCLDICGRNEHGELYTSATLKKSLDNLSRHAILRT